MVGLPHDVDGLLVNLQLKDAGWMRFCHPGELKLSNDGNGLRGCFHHFAIEVRKLLDTVMSSVRQPAKRDGNGENYRAPAGRLDPQAGLRRSVCV